MNAPLLPELLAQLASAGRQPGGADRADYESGRQALARQRRTEKLLGYLRVLRGASGWITAAEIAEKTGLKATAARSAATDMTRRGWLESKHTSRAGWRLVEWRVLPGAGREEERE